MPDDIFKEVRFDLYCSQCKEEKTKETDDPCNECLAEPINQYSNKPIYEFISYIMDKWLIDHHYSTALEKLYGGRDGFYFELTDGYYFKKSDFEFKFQGNRFIQLMQVMKDLDLITGGAE